MAKKATKKAAKTTKKAATKKTATKKAATTKKAAPAAKKTKRKAPASFSAPYTPSTHLAAIVGSKPLPRAQVTKKIWDYIKKNNLQDKTNRRMINADDKLLPIFGVKTIDFLKMTGKVSKHLTKA